jgi:hypothetical protein
MSKTIQKFSLSLEREQKLLSPPNAEVILVTLDAEGQPALYAMVDPTLPREEFVIHTIPTGDQVPPNTEHIGSLVFFGQTFHLFS